MAYSAYIGGAKEITWDKIQPGDIVQILASERSGTSFGHVAIYIGDNKIVEAKGRSYGVVESPLEKSRFKHVFKWIND